MVRSNGPLFSMGDLPSEHLPQVPVTSVLTGLTGGHISPLQARVENTGISNFGQKIHFYLTEIYIFDHTYDFGRKFRFDQNPDF